MCVCVCVCVHIFYVIIIFVHLASCLVAVKFIIMLRIKRFNCLLVKDASSGSGVTWN